MTHKVTNIEEAWLAYHRKLHSFIFSKVGTSEDAEDILNDVFEKLAKATNKNAIPDNISSWLYRVTKNRIVDYYRGKRRFEQLPQDLSGKTEDTDTIEQLSKCMLPMIQALPEIYQQSLVLSEIDGKKHKEVAIELGLTVSAVKSRILRGRKKLHNRLVSCCTIYRNDAGETTDYDLNLGNFCTGCED